MLLVFSLTNMPQFKNKEKSTYFTGDTKIFSKSKLPKHFRIFISCSSTFEHFSFFSTYDKVEKNKISIVISYSSTFECFSFSSSFMHKWRRRKKVFEKPSLMTIELSLVVKNKKRFSMVISYSSTFEYFFLSFFTYA